MARRGSRLSRKLRGRRKLRPVGYWKIRKSAQVPPVEVLSELKMRPLDIKKFARTKNGDK